MTYKQAIIVASASTVSGTKLDTFSKFFDWPEDDWFVEDDYLDEGDECSLSWSFMGPNLECREGLFCREQFDKIFDGFMGIVADSGFGICVDP